MARNPHAWLRPPTLVGWSGGWRSLLASLAWAGLTGAAGAAGSGGRILNQAGGEYVDPATARVLPLLSNVVEVRLEQAPGLRLVDDGHLQATAGSAVLFTHLLTNPGSAPGDYRLTAVAAAESGFALEDGQVWLDRNGNGTVDAGEENLGAIGSGLSRREAGRGASPLRLNAQEEVRLAVTGRVPATVLPGTLAIFDLWAEELGSGQRASNRDTVEVVPPPGPRGIDNREVSLRKSVTPGRLGRLEEATWRLQFSSEQPLPFGHLTIDGQPVSQVLLRDPIPPNTTFARFGDSYECRPLYHWRGDGWHDYRSAPPADLREVDAVAWAYPEVKAEANYAAAFVTTINGNASGRIPNTAVLHFGEGQTVQSLDSNLVEVVVPLAPPVIRYFTDATFTRIAPFTRLERDLFVQADASACNLDAGLAETVSIAIASEITGDLEYYTATESGPNTGVFQILPPVPTADAAREPARPGDGVLATVPNDVLLASLRECGGTVATTTILVDPHGTVFDSRTNRPVAGARVTLVDVTGQGNGGRPGQPARVVEEDFVTSAPATVTTGADGRFAFPLVAASRYRVEIQPPESYAFPSAVPRGLLEPERLIRAPDSYGGAFSQEELWNALRLDLPLDPTGSAGVALTKEVSRDRAEVGDAVVYTLSLRNTTGALLRTTTLDDHLPHGFFYEAGSARLDGRPLPDPAGGAGPHLAFFVGSVPDGDTAVVTYRVRLGPGSDRGTGINRARATSLGPPVLRSNEATAQVRVESGIFHDEGVIFGRVYVDLDQDGRPGPADLGVPGVRVYLEDGTYAITDEEGKYSLYGQRPVTHAVKVDPFTLPAGTRLATLDTRHAGDADLRFADLKRGELHKANFAAWPDPAVVEEVRQRRAQTAFTPEYQAALQRELTADGRSPLQDDPRGRPASGTVGETVGAAASYTPLLPARTLSEGNSRLPAAAAPRPQVDLELLAQQATDPTPDFLDLREGDTTPLTVMDVRLRGRAGSTFSLTVNGEEVSPRRLGKAVENTASGVRLEEYIGVALRPGENRLEFLQLDPFGNARGGRAVRVFAPDQLTRLRLSHEPADPVADGLTPLRLGVRLEDAAGRLVTARTPLTLESDYGEWLVADLDPNERGVQVFLEGGEGQYDLRSGVNPGEARLVVSSGRLESERRVRFLAQLRPFVVAGVAEGRLHFADGDEVPGADGPEVADEAAGPFEDTLGRISSWDAGDGQASGRVAAFGKGEVAEGWLLTASYDSAKPSDGRLFRDIEPDAYFPVYGDSSIRGFEAQSTSHLYARLENRANYVQWGDFATQEESRFSAEEARGLSVYQRHLTGAKAHFEGERGEATAWAAHTRSRQAVDEFPANGTSGPFQTVAGGSGLRNSEVVEILTRDRNQPSLILRAERLARFVDYEFEPFSGRLLLRRPVPSYDANFNPLSVRVTLEFETEGGDLSWVWGADGRYRLTDWWEVGGSFARDQNPAEDYELSGAHTTFRLGTDTYLIGEVARSRDLTHGEGWGTRAEWRHRSARTEARVYAGRTEETFQNPSALLGAGRLEAGVEATRDLTASTQLRVEGIYSEDVASISNRQGLRADVAHTLPNRVVLEVGGRVSEETVTPAGPAAVPGGAAAAPPPNQVRSVRFKAGAPVPGVSAATVYGEWENDVVETDRRIVAFGGDYQLRSKTRLYARHELIDSLGGEFQINSLQQNNRTLVGAESEYMRGGDVFSEYRVRDALDGRDAEAATGLRNEWDLAAGLTAHTSFERVTPFDGNRQSESTSATVALEMTEAKDWKATTRAEVRLSPTADSFLHTLGYARQLDPRWTALARSIVYRLDSAEEAAPGENRPSGTPSAVAGGSRDLRQFRLLGGLAYRPVENDTWNALLRYEFKLEDGSIDYRDGLERRVHLLGLGWNWQPRRSLTLSGRYAVKFVEESWGDGSESDYQGHLLGFRGLLDLTRRFDAGLSASVFFNGSTDRYEYALGPEIGCNFKKNLRLAVGWNFSGYEDRDFEDLAYSREGLFLSLRLKFDEDIWRDLWGSDEEDVRMPHE